MHNPFLNKAITYCDEYTNEEVAVDITNIARYFKSVYFLCPFDTVDESIFYQNTIDDEVFNNTLNVMVLYQANISIVKNLIHFGNLNCCQSDILKLANKFNYQLENEILVIPIYNISFLNIQKYIDINNGLITFNNFYDIMVLNNYFGDNMKSDTNKIKINNMIHSLDEIKYWEIPFNCLPNLTKLFDTREFNFNVIRVGKDKELSEIIERLDNSPIKENYIEQIFNSKKYIDPSQIINKKGYKLYWRVTSCEYNNEHINKLLKSLDYKMRYYLFSYLCVTKKYCHLVINNKEILDLMQPVIHQYIDLYRYLFGYAWIRFYFEETINRFKVKTNDMYIFDIDTASKLPVFEFNHNIPQNNPYFPLLVAGKSIFPNNNIEGVIGSTSLSINHRICNLVEFKDRINIFISGDKSINILEGINFKELKIAITGSIMTACVQYKHPLMNLFKNNNNMNEYYTRYFEEYYYDSDIDIMVMSSNIYNFFDITKTFHEQVMLNICQYMNAEPEHIKYIILRNSYLFVTSEFIREHICNERLSYEVIVKNLEFKPIISLFVPYAKKMHQLECEKKLSNSFDNIKDKYSVLFEFDEESLVIKLKDTFTNTTMINKKSHELSGAEFTHEEIEMILNCNKNVNEEKIESTIIMTDGLGFSDSFKIRITSPHLVHDIEMFPIFKDDFMTTVANFHMPCVRAYYNGENVYMTPSFITAHLTFMNIDYKYFAGSKDPINIINKYRMRGFGVYLNKKEIETYLKYCHAVPFWNNLFKINPLSKKSYNHV
jgi:hypothetical protein